MYRAVGFELMYFPIQQILREDVACDPIVYKVAHDTRTVIGELSILDISIATISNFHSFISGVI